MQEEADEGQGPERLMGEIDAAALFDELEKISAQEGKKPESGVRRAIKAGLVSAAGAGLGYAAGTGAYHLLRKSPRIKQLERLKGAKGKLKFWIPAAAALPVAAGGAAWMLRKRKNEAIEGKKK